MRMSDDLCVMAIPCSFNINQSNQRVPFSDMNHEERSL